MDVILFFVFAIVAVVCAINVVVQTHPISSAISLVGVMGSLAAVSYTHLDVYKRQLKDGPPGGPRKNR